MWKWRAGEWISGCSLSGKYSIEHEDYQKKGPLLLIYVVNIKGFRTRGMSFTRGYAHMISYYCTMKFLPSPGCRKLCPISSTPPYACGSSKGELTPWSLSLIPHITSMLASPGSEQESLTQRTSGAGKGTQMPPRESMDTVGPRHIVLKTWAHARRWLTETLQEKTVIDRTSIFFLLMWNSLWKSAEIIS